MSLDTKIVSFHRVAHGVGDLSHVTPPASHRSQDLTAYQKNNSGRAIIIDKFALLARNGGDIDPPRVAPYEPLQSAIDDPLLG